MDSGKDADTAADGDSENVKPGIFKMPVATSLSTVKKKTAEVARAFTDNDLEKSDTETNALDSDSSSDASLLPTTDDAGGKKSVISTVKQKSSSKSFSPAEQMRDTEAVIPYKEPPWGGITDKSYYFEVIKNGSMADRVELTDKSYYVFGRLPSCDHAMDHPSLSRYHAVIQHCAKTNSEGHDLGWYLYDLDSTHGTWINKSKVSPRVFHRLRVGYVVKFGGSTRLYILQGPESDQDDESELSVAELKVQRERQKKEVEVLHQLEAKEMEEFVERKMKANQDVGCTWGFGDDAEAEDSDEESGATVLAAPTQEELYIEDPKKALRGFFEREGWELPEYEFVDEGRGKHTCRVEIPIDTPSGEPVVAEVTQTGSRKDAVVACALEACRILDKHGLLRKATHESRAKKSKNWEEADFYDSDDDTFLDRTGDVERKRQKRISRIKPLEKKTENFESLSKKLEEVNKELSDIDARLERDKLEKASMEEEGVDALDAFMLSIKSGGMDSRTRMELKRRGVELRQQRLQLERLVVLAKPCSLPPPLAVNSQRQSSSNDCTAVKKPAALPMFGRIKTSAIAKPTPKETPMRSSHVDDDVVEEEDDDEDEESNSRDSESTQSTNPSMKSTSEHHSDEPQEKSSFTDTLHSAETENCLHKPAVIKSRKRKSSSQNDSSLQSAQYCQNDPDYAVWIPPQDQQGDGRTHLNEKFGY